MTATLFVVATPIGNLEDVSPRAKRVLAEAEVIFAEDTRTARKLLTHLGIAAPRIESAFEGNEVGQAFRVGEALSAGRKVALVSEAGMPGISDPGQRIIAAVVEAGHRVEVVPGPVAAISALVASGLPTDRFFFVGFLPREGGARRQEIGQLRGVAATLVFYESPERVGATLADLRDGLGGERLVCLGRELTKKFEEHVRGTLDGLAHQFASQAPRGECTLIVAGAVKGVEVDIDIEAELATLLDQGMGPKEAAQRLVVVTGKPRRQLYQLALALKQSRDRSPSGD